MATCRDARRLRDRSSQSPPRVWEGCHRACKGYALHVAQTGSLERTAIALNRSHSEPPLIVFLPSADILKFVVREIHAIVAARSAPCR